MKVRFGGLFGSSSFETTEPVWRSGPAVGDLLTRIRELEDILDTAVDGLAERDRFRRALETLMQFGERLMASEDEDARGIGCCICEGARVVRDTFLSSEKAS